MSFRSARLRAGLKVADVMREMQVSDAAVYMWETGQTSPRTGNLMKLAALYRCSVDELLTPDGDRTESVFPGFEHQAASAAERSNVP